MAKGKHSASSANRRLEAARDHIDRLTDQLAEAKRRARQVEADAAQVPKLRERVREMERREAGDEALAEAINIAHQWRSHGLELRNGIERTWRPAILRLGRDFATATGMTPDELVEYMERRFPELTHGLTKDPRRAYRSVDQGAAKRMSDESYRRLQVGLRARHPGTDYSEMVSDLIDAREAGFTPLEVAELLDWDPTP